MKNIFLKTLGLSAFTFIVLFAAQISVIAQEQEKEGNETGQESSAWSPNSIVGVWVATVTPRNCQTGVPVGPPFQSLLTFNKGRTMAEYGANPATPFRSNGQGIWEPAEGRRRYSIAFTFFPLTPGGIPIGRLRVEQAVELSRSGNEIQSNGSFVLRDPNGNVIAMGCSTSTAFRFE